MKSVKLGSAALIAMAGAAHAGGLERTDQSVAVLFEQGRVLELSFAHTSPDVSGTGSARTPTPGAATGDIALAYNNLYLAYKADIGERLSYAVIYDEPYGADIRYPTSGYFASGSNAELNAQALTAILQYNFAPVVGGIGGQFSVYGGPRVQRMDAEADVPFIGRYAVTVDSEIDYGYLVGAAWERPEFGMRVSLTYTSEINHDFDSQETIGGRTSTTKTDIDTPESVTLEFQTGVNPKTLVFGSVRWVPWSNFEIAPPVFVASNPTGSPLAFYEDDRLTYRLGLGRRLSDAWSVFGVVAYENDTGSPTGNLTPYDGFTSYTLGATHTRERVRITAAATYIDIGDADTLLGTQFPAGQFRSNEAWRVGVRLAIDLN